MFKLLSKKLKDNLLGFFFFYNNPDFWWYLRNKALSKGLFSLIAKLLYIILVDKYNSFLPLDIEFVGKPIFPHGITGIFISSGAKIGSHCVIFHQVTIGSNTLKDSKGYGAPTVGNNVYIGCGAKIIGNVTIGNNVRIGANCVICEDIPDNSTVVIQKPRIIEKKIIQDNSFTVFRQ